MFFSSMEKKSASEKYSMLRVLFSLAVIVIELVIDSPFSITDLIINGLVLKLFSCANAVLSEIISISRVMYLNSTFFPPFYLCFGFFIF